MVFYGQIVDYAFCVLTGTTDQVRAYSFFVAQGNPFESEYVREAEELIAVYNAGADVGSLSFAMGTAKQMLDNEIERWKLRQYEKEMNKMRQRK